MHRSFRILLLTLLTPAACAVIAQEPAAPDGAAVYRERCATCHGADHGGGMARSLTDGDWQFGTRRNHIFRNIKFGIPQMGMPAYIDVLSDAEIDAVLDYVLAMEREAPPEAAPLPERLRTLDYEVRVEVFAEGLDTPWGIAFPDGKTALITEKPGRLRVVEDGVLRPEPVRGIPEVLAAGQGGLLDVAVHPDYAENGWVYLAYSHALPHDDERQRPAMTRIVRGRLRGGAWADEEVVFEAPHETYRTTRHHYGCRIAFDPDGYLYFTIGDRGADDHAQDLARPNGKAHRLHDDGRIPEDNPFVHREDALPSVFTYGHRNPQGLAVHPATGRPWVSEHGPLGGDELNRLAPGANYGWPVISYGRNYSGTVLTRERVRPGMEQPVMYWRPSTAVCGMDFYRGAEFPYWHGHLLLGALKYEDVRLLSIRDGRVIHEEILLRNAGRVRDVACGPDGAIYVVLNSPGTVLRLTAFGETRYD